MKTRHILQLGYTMFALGGLFLSGCGDSQGQDSAEQKKNLENAQTMRSYFDKAGGNYENLTAEDKAAYVKQCGSEEKAQQNWNLMKSGPGAADRSAPPAGGGTGQ